MAYTSINDPTDYFNTVLYTGNGSSQTITGVGFQPDWLWIKERSTAGNHQILDSVRSSFTKNLITNSTGAEGTTSTYITSVNNDGFAVGTNNGINQDGVTNVAWCWKAETAFSNDASSTSVGSIDSAGSVNETAGISICAYTGVSSAGTIKHGLSTAPSVIIWKNRSASNGWIVYHHRNTSAPETDYLELHATNATADLNTIMADTAPTSSVFSIGTEGAVGGGNTNNFIAYIFSERKGYSKFGSYVGNGNVDGTFVYTGFKPAWVMIKRTDSAEQWLIFDTKRADVPNVNPNDQVLYSPSTEAEYSETLGIDLISNGFKIRESGNFINNGTYIYMAFAESPFVNSNGIPTNAR